MEILRIFPNEIKSMITKQIKKTDNINEIRLRVNKEVLIKTTTSEIVLKDEDNTPYILSSSNLRTILEYVSNYSIYAYEDEIKQGYITIEGGHRIGLCGKVVLDEGGKIQTINYISSLNIRIASQRKGIADDIIPNIINGDTIHHVLIISPPNYGKTTLLRDIVRQLSDGNKYISGMNVGLVDERSEIAASYLGRACNDVGKRTDVLDGCPKTIGMLMLIRSMSPKVIAVDEIGSKEDVEAIRYVINSGCKIIATIHGNSLDEIMKKPYLDNLIKEHIFTKIIVIENNYKIKIIENIQNTKNVG